jgi:hypothetical protein
MVRAAIRGVTAIIAAVAISSPAWAQLDVVSQWLRDVPQPSALVLFLVAIVGVLVGRLASRKRREP